MLRVQPEYAHRAVWDALARREALQFEVLEFSAPPLLGSPDPDEGCRAWYRCSGLVHCVHGAFMNVNPGCGDPAIGELSRSRCRESCALAAELGASQVIFHSSAEPFLRGSYLDIWAGRCADFFTELAQTYGLTICVENSQDLDPEPIRTLLDRAGKGVAVCLDLGHANYAKAPLEAWFDQLGPAIACLHLSDNRGSFDDHLPLGDGTVDWALADRLFRSLGRDLPMTLEVGGIDGVEPSLTYLRRNGFFTRR